MKTLTIYGASDDLIECSGIKGCDEFNAIEDGPYKACLRVKHYSDSIRIHAIYAGSWAFAVTTDCGDDHDEMPWKITRTFGQEEPYSETLKIKVPDGAKVSLLKRC